MTQEETPPLLSSRASLTAPFRYPVYRQMWAAYLLSGFGGLIQMTGAAWLMTSLSSSTKMVALVQSSATLPILFFGLLGGALSDTFDRRGMMLKANIFMMSVSIVLTIVAWVGWLTPWQLLGLTFLLGCGSALNMPTWQASVSDFVPREHLPNAVLLNGVGYNISRSIAPALGGVILATIGVIGAFVFNVLSYTGFILCLTRWKPDDPKPRFPREPITTAMSAGLRYVAMSPNIIKVLMRGFCFGVGGVALLALLPLVARGLLQSGPFGYGILLGSFGFGGVIGALLSPRLRVAFSSEAITRTLMILFGLVTINAAFSEMDWLTNLGMVVAGGCWVSGFTQLNVIVQLSTPRWVLARVLALYLAFLYGGLALGGWLWGSVSESFGIQTALVSAGMLLFVAALLGVKYPVPALATLDLDPLYQDRSTPSTTLDLKPSSGPMVIEVEYLIDEEDVPAFLEAMEERRRIRLRDGASHWRLTRDLQTPQRWIMTYLLATWLEYLRHYKRSTMEDADVINRISALHQGSEPPKVRLMIDRQPEWTYAHGRTEELKGREFDG